MRKRRLTPSQYAVALLVVAAISAMAWLSAGGRPAPAWITGRLIPVLGWLYLVLLAARIVVAVRRRRDRRRSRELDGG